MGEGDGGWGNELQPKILFLCDINIAAGGHVNLNLTPYTCVIYEKYQYFVCRRFGFAYFKFTVVFILKYNLIHQPREVN